MGLEQQLAEFKATFARTAPPERVALQVGGGHARRAEDFHFLQLVGNALFLQRETRDACVDAAGEAVEGEGWGHGEIAAHLARHMLRLTLDLARGQELEPQCDPSL